MKRSGLVLALVLALASASAAAQPATAPPAATPTQIELNEKIKNWFVGEWTSTTSARGVRTVATTTYRADGTMVGRQELTVDGGTQTYPYTGSYEILAIDDKQFMLTIYAQSMGSTTATLEIVDDNTLYNRQANYQAHRLK